MDCAKSQYGSLVGQTSMEEDKQARSDMPSAHRAPAIPHFSGLCISMNELLLDKASDYAFARLTEVGGGVSCLPIPLQTVVVICSAQGLIDNGGLEYFYESDFDGTPEYSFFVNAYRRIGAESAAACIEESAAMFPFDQPHLHESKRQEWIDIVRDDENHTFMKLSRRICGDSTVFQKLSEYVGANRDDFKSA